MTDKLQELIDAARKTSMSFEEKEEQRRSFAYGNANIENKMVTRDTIDRQAERLKSGDEQ